MNKPQNFKNHEKFVPLYHFVLAPIALILFIASIVNLFSDKFSLTSILILGISICIIILVILVRQFATKLQDRSIYNEENLRHKQLTGKPLDPRLNLQQIIALRFAEDAEFPQLCLDAAKSSIKPVEIKKSITRWRADHIRV